MGPLHRRTKGFLAIGRAQTTVRPERNPLSLIPLERLAALEGRFDIAYLDAVKEEYRRYLDLILPRLEVGGLLVADNALWKGRVAGQGEEDAATRALRAFNGYLAMHPQMQALVLPLGDGLALAVKTRPTVMELGGPF